MIAGLRRSAKAQARPRGVGLRYTASRVWRWFRRKAARLPLRLAGLSPLASSLYFCLFSAAFRREHHAVVQGLLKYGEQQDWPGGSSAVLRRSIHRLEKGLLMRHRRPAFAVGYIHETVACYARAVASVCEAQAAASSELRWAHDVLKAYFHQAGDHPAIRSAHLLFHSTPWPEPADGHQRVPYRRDLSQPPPVRYEDLLALARRRRSVRWFLRRPVPREVIDRAILVAAQSPSACNRQPFVLRVIDDPGLLARVAQVPMGAAGFWENIPVLVLVVGQQRHFFSPRDRHLIYVDGALAAMGFLYAAEAQGLSTCCINWPDIRKKEALMARLLGLEPDERIIMCIAVGYPDPDGLVACSEKKPLEQLRRYNFE